MVPCSIWMPPWASGPVFTVKRPMRTGLAWALAGPGNVTPAASAVPARNVRRSSLAVIGSPPGAFLRLLFLFLSSDPERRGLFGHPPSHRHVAKLIPELIHFGQHGIIGLLDVDGLHGWHPAGSARDPEHLGAIALGVEEVAADGAGVVDDALDAIAVGDQAPAKAPQVVEGGHPHGDLLDQMRIRAVGPPAHERDLVVDGLGVRAQKDGARAPVLLGHLHAHDVAVERDHPIEVAHIDADVSEPCHPCHGSPSCVPRLSTARRTPWRRPRGSGASSPPTAPAYPRDRK